MKPKIFIILVILIVVPAIFLSVMAARALYNWDIILQKRLQSQAYDVAVSVKKQVDDTLRGRLNKIINAVKLEQVKGTMPVNFNSVAMQLESSDALVRHVYIFMNPWDFIYPGKLSADEEQLKSVLRSKIASAPSPSSSVFFNSAGKSYCFGMVSMRGMYAGYEINKQEFYNLLQKILKDSAAGLLITAEGDGVLIMPEKGVKISGAKDVIIEDPFGTEEHLPFETVLAQVNLGRPFADITIKAKVKDEQRLRAIAATRRSFYGWVSLLMLFGISSGVIIVWRLVVSEIRRARLRSNYVAGISHDLRTPLSSMKVLLETIISGKVIDKTKEKKFLEIIFKESERLSQLVERVLFFVRYGQGALVFKRELTDIADLVNEAVEVIGERISLFESENDDKQQIQSGDFLTRTCTFKTGDREKVEIHVDIENGLPLAYVDSSATMQVVLNLIDNAIKYSRSSEEVKNIRVDITAHRYERKIAGFKKEWVVIAVRDFGIGIEKKIKRKIFERFYRSPRAAGKNISGVGLGLALCKYIIKAHKGKIVVESRVDEGSTFFVYIPVVRD